MPALASPGASAAGIRPPLVGALATIGDRAFAGCSSLTTINLPAGLATIGGYAFYGCRALDEETMARLAFLGVDLAD